MPKHTFRRLYVSIDMQTCHVLARKRACAILCQVNNSMPPCHGTLILRLKYRSIPVSMGGHIPCHQFINRRRISHEFCNAQFISYILRDRYQLNLSNRQVLCILISKEYGTGKIIQRWPKKDI